MKAVKYLILGAAIVGFSSTATAQQASDQATIDQVTKIIKSKSADAESQVKDIYKANKKNPAVLTAIGRAYLDVKDTAKAENYAQQAIKRDKTYGNAYVLLGDIAVAKDDGGAASQWYQNAIYFDKKNPEGYRRYAQINSKVDPQGSVATLDQLRAERPDYPVDIIQAEIWDKAGNMKEAIKSYEKVYSNASFRDKMEDYQLASYATNLFLSNEYQTSYDVSTWGLKKFSNYAGLNRVALYDAVQLKKYNEAVGYAQALEKSDKVKPIANDYMALAQAYLGLKENDKAIEQFQKVVSMSEPKSSNIQSALKEISTAYQNKGDYDNAVKYYNQYLDNTASPSAYDLSGLAVIYQYQAQETTDEATKKDVLMKADKVYEEMENKFESQKDYATYQRALIQTSFDPDTKDFLALPFAEKLVSELDGKTDNSAAQNSRLAWAYAYKAYHAVVNNQNDIAKEYCEKALAANPDNSQAKQILEAIAK